MVALNLIFVRALEQSKVNQNNNSSDLVSGGSNGKIIYQTFTQPPPISLSLGFKRFNEPPTDEVPAMSVAVTLSQNQIEKLLNIIEESERCLLEARTILSMNVVSKPDQAPAERKAPSIEGIKWRVKGGGSAEPNDVFAFDFVSDRDGRVSKEKSPILDYIKQRGPFQTDGYEVNLSKDGKFLQRKKVQA